MFHHTFKGNNLLILERGNEREIKSFQDAN
jgi:hypothetical protein